VNNNAENLAPLFDALERLAAAFDEYRCGWRAVASAP